MEKTIAELIKECNDGINHIYQVRNLLVRLQGDAEKVIARSPQKAADRVCYHRSKECPKCKDHLVYIECSPYEGETFCVERCNHCGHREDR